MNRAAKDGRTPVNTAAVRGHTAAIEALGKLGADVNRASNVGKTPLVNAIKNGQCRWARCGSGRAAAAGGRPMRRLILKLHDHEMGVEWRRGAKGVIPPPPPRVRSVRAAAALGGVATAGLWPGSRRRGVESGRCGRGDARARGLCALLKQQPAKPLALL